MTSEPRIVGCHRCTKHFGENMTTLTKLTLPFGTEGTGSRSHRRSRPSAGRCRSDRNCGRTWVWRGLCRSPDKSHTWAPSSGRLQMLRQWPFSQCERRHGRQHFRCRKWNNRDARDEARSLCLASFPVPTNRVTPLYFPVPVFSLLNGRTMGTEKQSKTTSACIEAIEPKDFYVNEGQPVAS